MANGGARPGAGRKRKLEKNVTVIEAAEKQIKDRLPEIVEAQLKLALGVRIDDGEDVYTKPPDRAAAEYLMNRIMGKPTERLEQDNSGALVIRVQYDSP